MIHKEMWRVCYLISDDIIFKDKEKLTKLVHIRLSEDEHRLLKKTCKDKHIDMSTLVRNCINLYLKEE